MSPGNGRLYSFIVLATFALFISLNPTGNHLHTNANANTSRPETLSVMAALSFSTYLGGNSARGVAVDSAGNIYVTGEVRSASLSITDGAAQPNFGGGQSDAFVIKLNPSGDHIIYATYIGGSDYDGGGAIAVDSAGNAYVTGSTGSIDFPTTEGAFQTAGRGPLTVFVAKLNPEGSALAYSTYLGNGEAGIGHDGRSIAIDLSGNAYVTGLAGPNFPTTAGAFQRTSGGRADAYVAKLNSTGRTLSYSTFLGGPDQDIGQDIAVDAAGNAYVVGGADRNFPTTAGAFKTSLGGANSDGDGFVAKLNPAGSALVYSTYIGGTNLDGVFGVAVDSSGSVYVTGTTSSSDFPTTKGAFLTSKLGVSNDVFAAKLNAAGSELVYSTYFGGKGIDTASTIAVDSANNVYITGATSSVEMPTPRAFQRTNASGPTFKSASAGQDWGLVNAGLSAAFVWNLSVDPSNPSTVYAATSDGVFKSADGGASWLALDEGLTRFEAFNVAVDPVNSQTLYAATRTGILKSIDGGASWSVSLGGFFTFTITVDPSNTSNVYAGVRDDSGSGVTRSTNGGVTWSLTRLPFNGPSSSVNSLAIDPMNTSTIYAGTSRTGGVYGTVFRSTDAGRSWTNLLLTVVDVHTIVVAPTPAATVYAATGEGAFRSDDRGANWIEINSGLSSYPISIVIDPINPSTIYASVEQSFAGGVFKSVNGGGNWAPTSLSNTSARSIAIDPKNPSNLYASTSVASDAFVAKFNSTGSALFYSTYLGGIADDAIFGINLSVDSAGNAYIAGTTRSRNFPTLNALRSNFNGQFSDSFLAKIEPGEQSAQPIITGALVNGKRLFVSGENFSDSAAVVLNGEGQKTSNDESRPNNKLIGKKAGKKIGRGQTVTIQVRNSEGTLSEPFTFTRSVE